MKKSLLLFAIMAIVPVMANASVTVEEQASVPTMLNNGYSKELADAVQMNKARANGVEYYTDAEKRYASGNKFTRFWKKFYTYFDPAAEDYSYFHHDTRMTPQYTDF